MKDHNKIQPNNQKTPSQKPRLRLDFEFAQKGFMWFSIILLPIVVIIYCINNNHPIALFRNISIFLRIFSATLLTIKYALEVINLFYPLTKNGVSVRTTYFLIIPSIFILICIPSVGTFLTIRNEEYERAASQPSMVTMPDQPNRVISDWPEQVESPPEPFFDFENPESIGRDSKKTMAAMIFSLNSYDYEYQIIPDSFKIDISNSFYLCLLLPDIKNKQSVGYNTVKYAIFSPGGIYSQAFQNHKKNGRAGQEKWREDIDAIVNAAIELIEILKQKGLADYDLHRQLGLRNMEQSDIYIDNYDNAKDRALDGLKHFFLAIKIAQKSGKSYQDIKGLFLETTPFYNRLTNNQELGKYLKDKERNNYDEYVAMKNAIDLLVKEENITKIEQKFP